MSLYAIGDLHLSFTANKPMDIFGKEWKDHVKKIEKNWNKMLEMVMDLMETAEGMFESGADRKEWVIAMVKGSADTINYDIDIEAISALIDSLCDMSKVVNNSVTPEETPDE